MNENLITPEIFDRLQKATAADPAELAGLYRAYLGEAREALVQLRLALARRDSEAIRERAHYVRGSSLIVGASLVARSCANLELIARDSELGEAARLLDHTSAALDAVEAELAKRLGPAVVPVEGSAA